MLKSKSKKKRQHEQWKHLAQLSEAELAKCDIATMNLVCALGLPGAVDLSVTRCRERIDKLARHVRQEIQRNNHRFHRDAPAQGFNRAQWEAGMMVTVLLQDCGVRYNPARYHDPDFTDARDLFINGMLPGDGGTCASLPVLYVAVGRRLGWPLKLVPAKGHLFFRWEDSQQWFNVEGSSLGFTIYKNNKHYHTWPMKISPEEIAAETFLYSMSPRDELACFLASRGHCLQDNQRFPEAIEAYRTAHQLSPRDPFYRPFLLLAEALAGKPINHFYVRQAQIERARIQTQQQKKEQPHVQPHRRNLFTARSD